MKREKIMVFINLINMQNECKTTKGVLKTECYVKINIDCWG